MQLRSADAPAPTAARFDEFVVRHRDALVRYAALLAGSKAQGEDLVHDVLVRLYPVWGTLGDPYPYVRRSVTNEFLSWRRRWSTRHITAREQADLDRPVEVDWNPSPDPDLWAGITALPLQQRAALVLRFYEGLSDTEIAAVLLCREVTVRAHVSLGLRSLRRTLAAIKFARD